MRKKKAQKADWLKWGAIFAALVFSLSLSSCSSDTALSAKEYQDTVLTTLRGDRLIDTGLDQIIDITIGDLGCEGEHCFDAIRLKFLRDEVSPRKSLVADYRARICKPAIKPPATHQAGHQALCQELQSLFNAFDSIGKNSGEALKFVSPSSGSNASSQALLRSFSDRLAKEKLNISLIRQNLARIEFLGSLFIQRI